MTKTETFKAGQVVRITNARSLAYGRIAIVMTAKGKGQSLVRFADLPKTVSASADPTGLTDTFANSDLKSIKGVPIATLYLVVVVVERNGDNRYAYHCLAHSHKAEQQTLANEVARCWYEGDGKWDGDAGVQRFSTHHFVLAEDWGELSMAEYINLRTVLTDCTPSHISGSSYGEDTGEVDYIRRQTHGL